jgi:hypothetical protein
MNAERVLAHYERIADAPDAIARLRRFVLDLAVRGKLVQQDPNDEPASELLKRIAQEKARLVKAGEIRKPKTLPAVDEAPFDIPAASRWNRIREVTSDRGQTVPDTRFTYIDVTAIDKEKGIVAEPKVLAAKEAPSRARKITRKGDVIYSCVRPHPALGAPAWRSHLLRDSTGAAYAACRTVEGGKNTVASCFHLAAAKACEVILNGGVMIVEEIAPTVVAERGGFFGRADDVGKQHCSEHAINGDRRPRARQEFLNRIGNLVSIVSDEG